MDEYIEQLKYLFPDVVSEGKIDFDELRVLLGDELDDRLERYSFTWAGRVDAVRAIQAPRQATVNPDFDASVDFDTTRNVFIEGDNLEVLKLLHKAYFKRVKMIYIDPPYNTGEDRLYPDDYSDPLNAYLRLTGQKNGEGDLLTSNPEKSGRYHSAWLSMLYPRLYLARQLLRDDGVVFVSIDDHEVHNLRMLMNRVFGEENFVAQITVLNNPKGRVLREHFAQSHDYILVYTKTSLVSSLSVPKTEAEVERDYPEADKDGKFRTLELRNTHRQFGRFNRPRLFYPLYIDTENFFVSLEASPKAVEVYPIWDDGFEGCWTWGEKKVAANRHLLVGRKVNGKWKVFRKSYAFDEQGKVATKKLQTVWMESKYHTEKGQAAFDELMPGRLFPAPKPVELIKTLARISTGDDDIVLDFFAGSCTTAQAIYELNREEPDKTRRFVLVQLPEPTPEQSPAREAGYKTISEIGRERMRRVIAKMRKAAEGNFDLESRETREDLGFKAFTFARSNYRTWQPLPPDTQVEEYTRQLELLNDPLIPDFRPEDVVYELALEEGYGLDMQVETALEFQGGVVWRVMDIELEQSFYISLDTPLDLKTLQPLNLTREELFICRSVGLDDTTAANLALQCRLKTI